MKIETLPRMPVPFVTYSQNPHPNVEKHDVRMGHPPGFVAT